VVVNVLLHVLMLVRKTVVRYVLECVHLVQDVQDVPADALIHVTKDVTMNVKADVVAPVKSAVVENVMDVTDAPVVAADVQGATINVKVVPDVVSYVPVCV